MLYEVITDDYVGSIRRLGLIAFRLAMIMTALRIIDTGEISSVLVCNDSDFNTVMEIVKVLVLHAAYIFEQLPNRITSYNVCYTKLLRTESIVASDTLLDIEAPEKQETIVSFLTTDEMARIAQSSLNPTVNTVFLFRNNFV